MSAGVEGPYSDGMNERDQLRVVVLRNRELEQALRDILTVDPIDAALDPQRPLRIARAALSASLGEHPQ